MSVPGEIWISLCYTGQKWLWFKCECIVGGSRGA